MKPRRSIQPSVESLEHKALLSAQILPATSGHVAVPAVASAPVATEVQLLGGLGNSYGGVTPLGYVRGQLNLARKRITLSNFQGTLDVQLSQVYHHRYTTIARTWQIIGGTGQYADLEGRGPGVFTVVSVRGRVRAWSAAFY
jgi:hypothetical protein